MAEKKQHKIVSASTGKETSAKPAGVAAQQIASSTVGLRIGSAVLWVAAVVCEFLALKAILAPEDAPFIPGLQPLYAGIAFLVVDLICVIIGSLLWKKANHIHPASEKNALKFWLWNNMGVIVCVVAFVPLVILMLLNKDLDKKTKAICTVVAVIAMLIGGLSGYDFNPVSAEQLDAAVEALGDEQVYWAPFGKVYHTHEDCSSLNQSETLTVGTVEQAVAAGRTRLCYFCAQQDNITTVVTDGD